VYDATVAHHVSSRYDETLERSVDIVEEDIGDETIDACIVLAFAMKTASSVSATASGRIFNIFENVPWNSRAVRASNGCNSNLSLSAVSTIA
jgi:hypothetical protein